MTLKRGGRVPRLLPSIPTLKSLVRQTMRSLYICKTDCLLVFQQIEADEYMDWGSRKPVVRFYGVTEVFNV